LACARFSPLPGILISGGISRRYFRVHNDAISPFSEESTPFRLESGEFTREFLAIRHGQPQLSIPSATTPFPARRPPFTPPFRARRRPPRAARPPGRTTSRAPVRARSGLGGEAVGEGRYIYGEGNHRENKHGSSFACRADHDCFTSCARIYSLGVHAKVYSGRCLHIRRVRGFRCRQVYVKEYVIAGGKERPPVRLSRAGPPAAGAAAAWPRDAAASRPRSGQAPAKRP
jgi:hypothetical protein